MSLKELIHNCKRGDRSAQEQLYRDYAKILFGICLKYSRNKTEAEDNLHDSFMTIYDKIGQYKFKGSFEGWIKRITVNTVLQKYRKEEYLKLVTDNVTEEPEIHSEYLDIELPPSCAIYRNFLINTDSPLICMFLTGLLTKR